MWAPLLRPWTGRGEHPDASGSLPQGTVAVSGCARRLASLKNRSKMILTFSMASLIFECNNGDAI